MLSSLPISIAYLFLFVSTHFYFLLICKNLFLSVPTYMNIKTSKVLIFLLLKTLWHEDQIMNSTIILHKNISTKPWILIFVMTILQLKAFKTQIATNTRALVYHRVYDSVVERIKHEASGMLTYQEKSWNPVRSRFFITQASQP